MDQIFEILNQAIFRFGTYVFTIGNFVLLAAIIPMAMVLFWAYQRITNQLYRTYEIPQENQIAINRFFKTLLYWICGIALVRAIGLPLPTVMGYPIWQFAGTTFLVSNIVYAILIYILGRTLLWVITELLDQFFNRQKTDKGARFAITQLLKYIIYTATILAVLETLGFKLNVIWGGAAALLVGFGLGLQQLFNDLVSGILIMFEGTVQVGDVVEVDNFVGSVLSIGLRASKIRTRDNITVIVPNSHLVMDGVVNWSHAGQKKRFFIKVGVAYGSDADVIKALLLDVALRHEKILDFPEAIVRFVDFGDSSLDFELHFWTYELERIQDVLSDLRFDIYNSFNENNIEIPFPQRDVWMRTPKQ